MSIHALIYRGVRRRGEHRDELPMRGPSENSDSVTAVAATLSAYVPTEAIALYTSALAFLIPDDTPAPRQGYADRWILAGVVMILAVLYAVGIARREQKLLGADVAVPWATVLVVIVAFTAWVCVIPGSPFNAFEWYTPSRGAVIGMVTQVAIAVSSLYRGTPDDARRQESPDRFTSR